MFPICYKCSQSNDQSGLNKLPSGLFVEQNSKEFRVLWLKVMKVWPHTNGALQIEIYFAIFWVELWNLLKIFGLHKEPLVRKNHIHPILEWYPVKIAPISCIFYLLSMFSIKFWHFEFYLFWEVFKKLSI